MGLPSNDRGRPGESAASELSNGDSAKMQQAVDTVEHHARRCLVDALLEAWPTYWERRARVLEAARPRAGDFYGRASREELQAQYDRLTEAARACRARAQVSPLGLVEHEVDAVLSEVA
jgi:hypothetical protein